MTPVVMKSRSHFLPVMLASTLLAMVTAVGADTGASVGHYPEYSGIYPHLAYFNHGGECGTGAVVPWAGRLWIVTYSPHQPRGSDDRLYEISPDLVLTPRPESIGGTPANRLIHRESRQLFLGPYVIDAERRVRVIPYTRAPGRLTGTARHLTDPAGKVYTATMEEGLYEIDVQSLAVKVLNEDGNGQPSSVNFPGAHGKGLYSGQGVLVYTNNGENSAAARRNPTATSGSLMEWDGSAWHLVRRNQFVEVTGPGGIRGNENPSHDPLWSTGWDFRSLLLGIRDPDTGWNFYRLPKADHSYDGAHGWNTEWPRIRNIGTAARPDYLMTMHGMFWHLPATLSANHTAGIRPRSAYLKIIADFARWDDFPGGPRLVFGCDDSAANEFLNKRAAKGGIDGPGQSNSNLWFVHPRTLDHFGPASAAGAVWIQDAVKANHPSLPFLFAGWKHRAAWVEQAGPNLTHFEFEIDCLGTGEWTSGPRIEVPAGGSGFLTFPESLAGEWIRVRTDRDTTASVYFVFNAAEMRGVRPHSIFRGLAPAGESEALGGLLWSLGEDRRKLGVAAMYCRQSQTTDNGYYELDADMNLVRVDDPQKLAAIKSHVPIPRDVIFVDAASVLVVDRDGRRWRLPKSLANYDALHAANALRVCREVVTERDLLHAHGTFYELPAENAGGYAVIRPVATHPFRIHDYASYRGLLVLTGISVAAGASTNPHLIRSHDGKAAVWAGAVDDLWKLGKPTGHGGPWRHSAVRARQPSDPYLIGFYDERSLTLSHASGEPVTISIEVDPAGHAACGYGPWVHYLSVVVAPGQKWEHRFPPAFSARWIRFTADRSTTATALLEYR